MLAVLRTSAQDFGIDPKAIGLWEEGNGNRQVNGTLYSRTSVRLAVAGWLKPSSKKLSICNLLFFCSIL
jgi:hypothetical protein